MSVNEEVRADWNRRAIEGANFYVAFGRQCQSEEEFLASAAGTVSIFRQGFGRLPALAPVNVLLLMRTG